MICIVVKLVTDANEDERTYKYDASSHSNNRYNSEVYASFKRERHISYDCDTEASESAFKAVYLPLIASTYFPAAF